MSDSDASEDDFSLSSDDDFEAHVGQSTSKSNKLAVSNQTNKSKSAPKTVVSPPVASNLKRSSTAAQVPQESSNSKKIRMSAPNATSCVAMPASNVVMKGPPVASAAEARSLIKSYMLSQNRPFSCIQVFDNLHHRVTKTDVQKGPLLFVGEYDMFTHDINSIG